MFGRETILNKTPEAGGCTNTVDLYNPFPDGGGVALYQLNGDATDVSGNYDGTATNVTYGAGQFGQAGVFNGSSSYIQLPSLINFGTSSYTISLWFKVSNVNVFQSLFSTYNGLGIIISQQSNGTVRFYASGGQGIAIATSELTVADTWYNVVCTMGHKDSARIYLNGQLQNEYVAGTQTIGSDAGANPNIGRLPSASAYTNGSIDQVRIFNRILRPYEVEALYTEEYCTPTIVPSEHFNTVTYTGNGGANSITGVGFQPDFTWIKSRVSTNPHNLFDSIRGAGFSLMSNNTAAEIDETGYFTSFDADGFSFGLGGGNTNFNGYDYVAWNFKAGGAAVTNTDGTITSQVSANTEAGFSIVSYTGTGANGTVGHGLSLEPKFIITKNRNDSAENWNCWHTGLSGNGYRIILNTSQAEDGTSPTVWNSNINPTLTTFSLGSAAAANGNGNSHIAYCFAEVEGFSSFGSYVGTGASSNTVITGFEPAFVMIKKTNSTSRWRIWDNKRDLENPRSKNLFAEDSIAETGRPTHTTQDMNFFENGFEIPSGMDAELNGSGDTFIYMAFAADPTAVEPTLEDSFNTVLYTGNRGTKEVTGIGFQPDFVWIKNRNAIASNFLHDTVRGKNNNYYESLISNGTFAESTTNQAWHDSYGWISDIYDGGFTVNQGSVIDDPSYNNTQDYVAWAWKGAEIPAINSNGSIPSVVSANPAAGFSIVSWTGNASTATIGHGLGLAPKMIITKARNVAGTRWNTFHASVGTGKYLSLETANAASTFALAWPTLPDEDVWYMSSWENYTGENYISYVFAEVAGFSKFGSYSGTGASGNTVTVGFEPAFVMIKRTDVAGNGWLIADNKRDTTNPIELFLSPNTSQAEFPITNGIDFNVTDFTIDSTNGSLNASGGTYIYMAFANQF